MNRMMRGGRWLLAATMLALSAGVMADGAAEGQEGAAAEQEPLTDERIERYLASMRDMQALAREVEGLEEEPSSSEVQQYQEEQAAILEEHGFDGQQDWMSAHQRIFQAATAVAVQREMADGDLEQQVEEQREQIRGQEDMPDEQKEAMLEQIDRQLETYRQMREHPDAEVVEPYFDEFREIFSEEM